MSGKLGLCLLSLLLLLLAGAWADPVLEGYDVVAYFGLKPFTNGVRGEAQFNYTLNGYEFWFATEENLQLFQQDPWKYAPGYGGYCAWGISNEYPPQWPWTKDHLGPPAGPKDAWVVHNNTLYFAISPSVIKRWLIDVKHNIEKADNRWIGWWGALHAGPFNTKCFTFRNQCM